MENFLTKLEPFWKPHPGQLEFLLSRAKTKVLACGRRWGKTDACAVQILRSINEKPTGKYLIVAPTLNQARILFDRFVEMFQLLWPVNDAKVSLSPFPSLRQDGQFVSARSAFTPRNLRGLEADDIIVDEAAYVSDHVLNDVLWPMLATTDGSMTLISTPHGFNAFWRLFDRGQRDDPNIWSRCGPSSENPRVHRRFLDMQRTIVDERTFQIEYEAAFFDTESTVFAFEIIAEAQQQDMNEAHGPISIGIDWGKVQDYTAVAVLQGTEEGCWLLSLQRFHHADHQQLARQAASISRLYPNATITLDSTGVGDAIEEFFRSEIGNRPFRGHQITASNKPEMIQRLVSLFQRRKIKILPDQVLLRELAAFRSVRTATGHVKLQAAGSEHDDTVIALALAASELHRPSTGSVSIGESPSF